MALGANKRTCHNGIFFSVRLRTQHAQSRPRHVFAFSEENYRNMDIEIALIFLFLCALAIYIIQRFVYLFKPQVWVMAETEVIAANVARKGKHGTFVLITFAYQAAPNPTGRPEDAAPLQRYEKCLEHHESFLYAFLSDMERIDRAMACEPIELWYARSNPNECYTKMPTYFKRILTGFAGVLFGAVLMGCTVYVATRGPDGLTELSDAFFAMVQHIVNMIAA